MPSDYEAITKHNELQLGRDTASRKTQISMYSDSTHFVYEILQNADDHGATEVRFRLEPNGLVIEHNGEPFTEENVKSITYFGKSTSRDDLVKTGHFGVGFKSVFAITATPSVISGDEHFQIYGLYRIKEYPYPDGFPRSRTRITLPFNHEAARPDFVDTWMRAEDAFLSIKERLTSLNMQTLLFTRNLREISWEIGDQAGHYLREDKNVDNARFSTITDGEHVQEYVVFSRIPMWENKEHRAVEIAFAFDEKKRLSPVQDCLYVLFATKQETRLRFILNGPYRTTPSRETFAETDAFNIHLLEESCALMKDALLDFKTLDLLTTQCLSVLPNSDDELGEFYVPIRDAIVESFQEEELVPTHDNAFASSRDVLLGPAPVREVITEEELPFLCEREGLRWTKGVTLNSRADRFLRGLDIDYWGWEQLKDALWAKYFEWPPGHCMGNSESEAWLRDRSDSWMRKLYILLADGISKGECARSELECCRIMRVRQDGVEMHTTATKALFPKRGYRSLPQIKKAILVGKTPDETSKVEESLIALGVSEVGEKEEIEILLASYGSASDAPLTDEQHLEHMQTLLAYWRKGKGSLTLLGRTIFRSEAGGEWLVGDKCYLDSPLLEKGLDAIHSEDYPDVPTKCKLWSGYQELVGEDFIEFAEQYGVQSSLSIDRTDCLCHPKKDELMADWYRSHVKRTHTEIDSDYVIPGLSRLLELESINVNRIIWETVRKADASKLTARYRPNQQYQTQTESSSFVLVLQQAQWIPDLNGELHEPCDISKVELHQDFPYDNQNGWLDKIGFAEDKRKATEAYQVREVMAAELSISVEFADFLAALPEEERARKMKEFILSCEGEEEEREPSREDPDERIAFHEALAETYSVEGRAAREGSAEGDGRVANPERRRERIVDDIELAVENEGKRGKRYSFGLRKKWKGKNDEVRVALANWYGGRCQMCSDTFTQRSGEPYFEGVYLVPRRSADWLDRTGNVLCLCPLHSAKFRFGPREVDEDVLEQVMRLRSEAEGGDGTPSIRMTLCGEEVEIEFAEKHLLDLQEMIRRSQEMNSE